MEEKEIKTLLEKFSAEAKGEIQTLFEDTKEGYVSTEKLQSEVEKLAKDEDIKGLEKSIEDLGLEMKKMREIKARGAKTLREQIAEKAEDLKKLKEAGKGSIEMNIKTDVTTSSITDDTAATRLPDIGRPAHRAVVIEQITRPIGISAQHGSIRYWDQSTTTRNAATKEENTEMPESAIKWTEYSLAMEKILDSIPISHEMLTDVDWAEAEIRNFLDVNMMLEEESQIYSGDGSAPNFEGLYSVYATDYTQAIAQAENAVADANLYDLIRLVVTKIMNGYQSKYTPNYVMLNPADVNRMLLEKDSTGQYVRFPNMTVQVVESSLVTANTMLVGDRNHSRYYRQEGFTLELGYNTGDFAYDRISLKARKRGNVLVRNVDTDSLYKVTDITQRITDITA